MQAQVSFLEGELSLIHIPLDLYSAFVQPILRVLLPQATSLVTGSGAASQDGLADNNHRFLNVSITPVECSIVCHTYWARTVFEPVVQSSLPEGAAKAVSISKDSYVALSVMSGGMDAGSRVVELSSPLALAGIPIFFVTTYYSDFILVPSKDRQSVVQALLSRGFAFSELEESSFVSPGLLSHPGSGGGIGGLGSRLAPGEPPSTPPPSNLAELETRTFNLLRKRKVKPYIVSGLHLAHCSGLHVRSSGGGGGGGGSMESSIDNIGGGGGGGGGGSSASPRKSSRASWVDTVDTRLYTCLVAAMMQPPQFLSVTLAAPDPPSVLLDKSLLPIFGNSLVGDVGGDLVPIFLDLVDLPFEATGIVSGVAGKLVEDMRMVEVPELSYLSTSKAGAVILDRDHATRALQILQPLLEDTEEESKA